jgi:methionyl-tRNA formyltransferase
MKSVFFGTPEFAVEILEQLHENSLSPSLIVTQPARPKGRKLKLTPSAVFDWGEYHHINTITPEKLAGNSEVLDQLRQIEADYFVVAAYGKILSKNILDIPKHGVLNVHPSLLPKYRGPSPIESAILNEDAGTGVSIMLLDEELDHGPIIAQEEVRFTEFPPHATLLEHTLANIGGKLLCTSIPNWVNGNIRAKEQEHADATYTSKVTKQNGEINLDDAAIVNLRKIRAYEGWPGAYMFMQVHGKSVRVRIVDAIIHNGDLVITRVIPEGKKEMDYRDFQRGI